MLALGFVALGVLVLGGRAAFVLLRTLQGDALVTKARELSLAERRLEEETARTYAERELESRKLDLKERALVAQEQRQKSAAPPTSIPPDLVRRIMRWESPDAQDGERKVLLDLYYEFRDCADPWVEVRAHLAPEPNDEPSEDIAAPGAMFS